MILLVYALASPRPGPVRLAGVRGERLEAVRIGSVDAIVGWMPRPPRPTVRTLRRYDRIVRALWARRSAVLPARFPSVMRDPDELARALRARQAACRRQLALVRQRAQMTVRLVPGSGPEAGSRDSGSGVRAGSPFRGRSRGTRFLVERARAARLDRVPEAGVVRAAVTRWVKAERAEARGGVATIYHLVPRSAAARYRRALDRAAATARVRLYASGPGPAYAFAEAW